MVCVAVWYECFCWVSHSGEKHTLWKCSSICIICYIIIQNQIHSYFHNNKTVHLVEIMKEKKKQFKICNIKILTGQLNTPTSKLLLVYLKISPSHVFLSSLLFSRVKEVYRLEEMDKIFVRWVTLRGPVLGLSVMFIVWCRFDVPQIGDEGDQELGWNAAAVLHRPRRSPLPTQRPLHHQNGQRWEEHETCAVLQHWESVY